MPQFIDITETAPVVTITLSRPEIHNAFDDRLIRELRDAFDGLRPRTDLRVAVLRGAGKSFSAGADIEWMRRTKDYSQSENEADAREMAMMFRAIRECPLPTIARVHGAAIGGGAGLVATCDIAIASTRAVFSFSEVRLGLIPAVISPLVIERIGVTAARRFMLTGTRFEARTAAEIGLVAEVVEDQAQLDERVNATVQELLKCGPGAIAACKELISYVACRPPADVVDEVARRIATLRVSPEGQMGLSSFLEKRLPAWSVD